MKLSNSTKRYKDHIVECGCDVEPASKRQSEMRKKGYDYSYPNSGKYNHQCPKCGYYPWYYFKMETDK